MMWFVFLVETLEKIDGCTSHSITKRAENSNYAMMQVVSDAMAENLNIEEIKFCGQAETKPVDCKERLSSPNRFHV